MNSTELPIPDLEAARHSDRVIERLLAQINANNAISFADYMQTVLYAPGFGYYSGGLQKFGPHGDFATAPTASPLFGQTLAGPVLEVLAITGGSILEFGAGDGSLAAALLAEINRRSGPVDYIILELSAELAARQRQRLATELDEKQLRRCHWLSALPDTFTGVMLANEVLDAMPVERFKVSTTGVLQQHVFFDDTNLCLGFSEAEQPLITAVRQIEKDLGCSLPPDYVSEINLLLPAWMQSVAEVMNCGLCLLFDYGYPRREYYLPSRNSGTLRCFYRHRVHDDPLWYPGLQDITSDVDFTAVIESADRAGLELHGFTTQARFLVGSGLLESAARYPASTTVERTRLAQQINFLSMPSGMGERFRVMGLSRGLEHVLSVFETADESYRL